MSVRQIILFKYMITLLLLTGFAKAINYKQISVYLQIRSRLLPMSRIVRENAPGKSVSNTTMRVSLVLNQSVNLFSA